MAFPAAALVRAALRSPLARIVVARPSSERWPRRETPSLGGAGIFVGITAGLGSAMAAGAIHPGHELLAVIGAIALLCDRSRPGDVP